jgi:hypothetical protein
MGLLEFYSLRIPMPATSLNAADADVCPQAAFYLVDWRVRNLPHDVRHSASLALTFVRKRYNDGQHLSRARSVHPMVPILGSMQLEGDAMSARSRVRWDRHVNQVIRSQHYTWLGEGLAGEPLSAALTDIMADIMHICARQRMSWEQLLARSRAQFEREEAEVAHAESA